MTQQTITKPLPCPFCGGERVSIREGSTYRWAFAECDECGASAGDIRRQYGQGVDDPEVVADATAEWNKRATPQPIKAGDITITMRVDDNGDPVFNFDGADDATLAPIAAAFSVAMNALMEGK
jgi:Lar family restriction alleviation protein